LALRPARSRRSDSAHEPGVGRPRTDGSRVRSSCLVRRIIRARDSGDPDEKT
jgi:hypothetical protein